LEKYKLYGNQTPEISEPKPKKRKSFNKPTVEQIQDYCKERNNTVDGETFFDFYESKGWLVGKTKMKDWKAAVRNWERSDNIGKSGNFTGKVDKQLSSWQNARKIIESKQ
jgi:hypothetical protein